MAAEAVLMDSLQHLHRHQTHLSQPAPYHRWSTACSAVMNKPHGTRQPGEIEPDMSE